MDKKCFIIWALSLTEFSSGLAGLSHSQSSMHSQAWTCSEWAPDSQGCMQPLRVRGPPCHQPVRAGGVLHSCTPVTFPNTSWSHDDRSLACYFCRVVIIVCGLDGCACRGLLSNPFFSGQAQLHFLWPYQTLCFQNCYSATCRVGLDSHPYPHPYILLAESNEENNWG